MKNRIEQLHCVFQSKVAVTLANSGWIWTGFSLWVCQHTIGLTLGWKLTGFHGEVSVRFMFRRNCWPLAFLSDVQSGVIDSIEHLLLENLSQRRQNWRDHRKMGTKKGDIFRWRLTKEIYWLDINQMPKFSPSFLWRHWNLQYGHRWSLQNGRRWQQ